MAKSAGIRSRRISKINMSFIQLLRADRKCLE